MHLFSRSPVVITALIATLAIPLFMFMASRANGTQAPSLVITAAHAESACGADDPFCLKKAATGGGLTPGGEAPSIPTAVGRILSAMLALLGVLFFALTVWAGFKWMTAQGNQETATSAKTTLENAVIGLVLVVVAYALTSYIVSHLFNSPSSPSSPSTPATERECFDVRKGKCIWGILSCETMVGPGWTGTGPTPDCLAAIPVNSGATTAVCCVQGEIICSPTFHGVCRLACKQNESQLNGAQIPCQSPYVCCAVPPP